MKPLKIQTVEKLFKNSQNRPMIFGHYTNYLDLLNIKTATKLFKISARKASKHMDFDQSLFLEIMVFIKICKSSLPIDDLVSCYHETITSNDPWS